ncbi:MAG TPA: tetratricopeptide repeat protein, partial [bacterium]|nr:tetratricopeptide repeat protein [bacterium]
IFLSGSVSLSAENSARTGEQAFQEGLRLKEQGAFLEAENALLEALRTEPTNPDYHFELANVYAARYDRIRNKTSPQAKEMVDRAERALEQAVMFRPDFVAAYFNLGVIYRHQGLYEESREAFRRVLELDPNQVQAQIQLGQVYEEQGFYDEARDEYLKARDMDYGNSETQSLLLDLEEHRQWAASRAKEGAMRSAQQKSLESLNTERGNTQDYSLAAEKNAGQVNQAIPYLAQVLVQQFMDRFRNRNSEE